jgi:hypothetical protein
VPLEKRLVKADILDAQQAFAGITLHNAIYHQKRIAVRQNFLDLINVENNFAHMHRKLIAIKKGKYCIA